MTATTNAQAPDSSPAIVLSVYVPLALVITAIYVPATLSSHSNVTLTATFATTLALPGILAAANRAAIAPVLAYAAPIATAAMVSAPSVLAGHPPFAANDPAHTAMLTVTTMLLAAAAPAILFHDSGPQWRHLTTKALATLAAMALVYASIQWPLP